MMRRASFRRPPFWQSVRYSIATMPPNWQQLLIGFLVTATLLGFLAVLFLFARLAMAIR